MRTFIVTLVVLVCGLTLWAAPPKDTPSAAYTRNKKLKCKVTVDFKNEILRDALEELNDQLDDADLRELAYKFAIGVSRNQRCVEGGSSSGKAEVLGSPGRMPATSRPIHRWVVERIYHSKKRPGLPLPSRPKTMRRAGRRPPRKLPFFVFIGSHS